MADKRYIITRSNYTIKEKHKSLKNGNSIYERDYMTTTNLGGWDSGSIPYGEGNFKFVHNQNANNTRSFNNGKWLEIDGDTVFTLNNLGDSAPKDESQIVIKPNKNTFGDFAYFGSCVELVKVSLEGIIKHYPAELYITSSQQQYIDAEGNPVILGADAFEHPVVIYNPFLINISKTNIQKELINDEDINTLRYFAQSYNKYVLGNYEGTETKCLTSWDVKKKNKRCYEDGELVDTVTLGLGNNETLTINEYFFATGNILITDGAYTSWHIRPVESVVDEVFEKEFTSFERFLLNRDTNPLYTIDIDVPSETDEGISISRQQFTFPTMYGWNLDITSGDYNKYVSKLQDVSEFYDEHYSNNLWENLVHESIKNMDIPFNNPSKNEGIDDYRIGIGNVHGLMLAYGRQFDDLKVAIENIKSTNTVSYDENNNVPDYFLSDVLELSGWEVSSAIKTLDETAKVGNLFAGNNKEYGTDTLNTTFMRNLKINSRAIFSHKGNRHGIEMLMSLFGFSSYEFGRNYYNCLPENKKITMGGRKLSWEDLPEDKKALFYDYKLDEYVVVAKNKDTDIVLADNTLEIERVNSEIKGDATITIVDGLYNDSYEIVNPLVGLPVRMVYMTTDDERIFKYLIPWFDKKTDYDGKTYFQMYGGWDKTVYDGHEEYTETLKYLNILQNIGQLSNVLQSELNEGDIYYVNDISDWRDYYKDYAQKYTEAGVIPSHYFYLHNVNKCYTYGDYMADPDESGDTADGWQIIPEAYVRDKVGNGAQVYHLENIVNDYTGNNPHVGYGKYDEGDKYLERLGHVFSGAIDDGLFEGSVEICENGEVSDKVKEMGFELTDRLIDNVKCWYFTDTSNSNRMIELQKKYTEIVDTEGESYEIVDGYEEKAFKDVIRVGKSAVKKNEVHMTSDLEAFNLETQKTPSNDEAAANSIINTKNITIEFCKAKYNKSAEFYKDFEKYLHEVVLPYMNQVVPSTSIVTIKYIGDDEFSACRNIPVITGVTK